MSTDNPRDERLRTALYNYLPGYEDETILLIDKIFKQEGYRQIKQRKDPDNEWRKKAKENNKRIAKKYAPMEGIKNA